MHDEYVGPQMTLSYSNDTMNLSHILIYVVSTSLDSMF